MPHIETHNGNPFIPERCPLPYRTNPSIGTENNGTPFLIKPEGFSGTRLRTHERVGAYFVHLLFFYSLWRAFGSPPFPRLNLDAKRLGYLMSDNVVEFAEPTAEDCETSYTASLRIDESNARSAFPAAFID